MEAVRIERQVTGAEEAYIGLLLDAAAGGVRVIMSAQGGMDVESLPPDAIRSEVAAPEAGALVGMRRASCRERSTARKARRWPRPARASRAFFSNARRC